MNEESEQPAQKSVELRYTYEKSRDCRVVYTDGAFGGATPHGMLYCAFYLERGGIPLTSFHPAVEKGGVAHVGPEIEAKRVSEEGIRREIQVELIFDVETAIRLRNWLDANIARLEPIR